MSVVPEKIIIKYLQGTVSAEETAILNRWMTENKENAEMFFEMQKIWESGQTMTDKAITCGWDNLCEKIHDTDAAKYTTVRFAMKSFGTSGQRYRIVQWARYAAAIVIGFVFAAGWYGWQQKDKRTQETVVQNVVYNRTGAQKFMLPDSSVLWLSGNSNISFNEHFDNGRQVVLSGKAYFDIRKTGQIFTVQSGNIEVEVTGTEFEVENTEGANIMVTLVSGSVSVKTKNNAGKPSAYIHLTPGQQVSIDRNSGIAKVAVIDPQYYALWKEGTYRFTDEPIEKIAEQLSTHYRIEIQVSSELKGVRFTGRVMPNQNIEDVMKIITASHPVSYRKTSTGIYIGEK